MKIVGCLIISLWLLLGLYFGIGGLTRANLDDTLQGLEQDKEKLLKESIDVSYDGIDFTNSYELKYYLEAENIEYFFPWAIKISSFISLIITAFSFGVLGSIINLIKEIVISNKFINEVKYLSQPILGLLTGLVILGLSYLLPTVLIKGGDEVRPITLMFLCLFGGMYTIDFYEKLSQYINKIFK